MNPFLIRIGRALRGLLRDKGPERTPPDPRALANPWLGGILDQLGDRYRLGADTPDGIQVLRRTGKARFNPMRAWLRTEGNVVVCEYEAHVGEQESIDQGRALLDRTLKGRLGELGLTQISEKVEAWHGHMITRRYEGPRPEVAGAVAAIRYICEYSEPVLDSATQ